MNWLTILMMILEVLRNLQKSSNKDEFVAATASVEQQIGGAPIIDWLWENREEILAFVMRLIELFSKSEEDKVTLTQQVLGK